MVRITKKHPACPTEHWEQCEFIRWFRTLWPGVRILAVPNGGLRNKATAGRLKAEGVCPGVPDLYVPAWRLWIEMKRARSGHLTPAQKDWIAYLEEVGDSVIVGYGAGHAIEQIKDHRAKTERSGRKITVS